MNIFPFRLPGLSAAGVRRLFDLPFTTSPEENWVDGIKKPVLSREPECLVNQALQYYSAGEIAPIGQTSAQVPQSTQISGLME